MRPLDSLSIHCPVCGAFPGDPCRVPTNTPRHVPHTARYQTVVRLRETRLDRSSKNQVKSK